MLMSIQWPLKWRLYKLSYDIWRHDYLLKPSVCCSVFVSHLLFFVFLFSSTINVRSRCKAMLSPCTQAK